MTHENTAGQASFAALIRTTGNRPKSLLDALQSVQLQHLKCLAIIIVHGSAQDYERVSQLCGPSSFAGSVVLLHANDSTRKRGYPINVGLDYCQTHFPLVRFVFILDDDDIVYPFFTKMMADAFLTSEADVVYACSNRRDPDHVLRPGYEARPIYHILRENFVTSNSFAVRFESLLKHNIRLGEDFEYLEDWHFLLQMLHAGMSFHPFPMTLSEFRTGSDGNLADKRDPMAWKQISLRIRRFINTSSFPVPGSMLAQLSAGVDIPGGESRPDTQETSRLRQRVSDLENSLSWKCTSPLRAGVGALMRLKGLLPKQ